MKKLRILLLLTCIMIFSITACSKNEQPEEVSISIAIDEIYEDYFSGTLYNNGAISVKVNSSLPSEYCVGDVVVVVTDDLEDNECTALSIEPDESALLHSVLQKPVIYFYPEQSTDISVKLHLNGTIMHTYPEYEDGWNVTAMPDGSLSDDLGNRYKYLFWDGMFKEDVKFDMSSGYCIKGCETEDFLNDKLEYLGLNDEELEEFMEYWLPQMQDNEYNIITFQTDVYTDNAALDINPAPDTLIRVFMVFKPSADYIEMPKPDLVEGVREGFTVVEWGGAISD